MKMLLLYAGESAKEGIQWDKENVDGYKLAWAAADSWARHGWTVERFITTLGNGRWTGRLLSSPYPYNNGCPELLEYMELTGTDFIWFMHPDWYNVGLTYSEVFLTMGIPRPDTHLCFHSEFQLSCGGIGIEQLSAYVTILEKFDKGELMDKTYPFDFVSDETVLKAQCFSHYGWTPDPCFRRVIYASYVSSASQTDKTNYKLIHYSRSACKKFPKRSFV